MGYAPDAIEVRILNLVEGANFSPEFLSLVCKTLGISDVRALITDNRSQNPNATLPTLVVDGKPYVNTTEVTRYLIEHAPKKVAPGSTAFIDRIHEDPLDPNFILLTAVSIKPKVDI